MSGSVRDMTTAIASGDTEAFARFYRMWFDFTVGEARRAAGSKSRDEQFCLDVVQETMMRVIRNMKPMDSDADVKRWLRVVAQSCCYDQFRSEQRRAKRERSVGQTLAMNANESESIEHIEWLGKQLLALDADDAHLLTLRFRFGWTLQRIGQALGLKPGAVDGRITRSLAGLRRKARENFDD